MNNAAVATVSQAGNPAIAWAAFKAEIDAGRPVISVIRPPGWFHTTVFDSYAEFDSGRNYVWIMDPWPGRSGWYNHANMPVQRYYTIAAGATGRATDANVNSDGDGDGVMDFDEQNPGGGTGQTARPFHSVHTSDDTDMDEVRDKEEIKNYTFHDQAGYHPGHGNDALNFPDVDGDGFRAENDCDSDNDSDFDGGEDIDGDGHDPIPPAGHVCERETCQFQNGEFCISVAVDKDVYNLGEPVYIVDQHHSRTTHTYHAGSTYLYEKGDGCPVKADGSPLTHSGSFNTDGGGHAQQTLVEYCLSPGQRYLTVDVLTDNLYSTPDNLDPQTCWECAGDWFHGFHWGYDYHPYHNPGLVYPNYDYPVTCVTNEMTSTIYTVETAWWWWCYEWPPVLDDYYLGIGVPNDLVSVLNFSSPPTFVLGTEDCSGSELNSFAPDEIITLELNSMFDDGNTFWYGYSIPNWQLPESLITTRVEFQVPAGQRIAAAEALVTVMAGDAVFGWSPTVYRNISLGEIVEGCCLGNRGDVNGDGDDSNIIDLTFTVDWVFRGSGDPGPCAEESDVNGDGSPTPNILDLTYLVDNIFRGGPLPGPCP
jgi:hypothetical protein